MDRALLQEKEFEAINCMIQDIKICLNCGSERIVRINNEARCENCGNVKSRCES